MTPDDEPSEGSRFSYRQVCEQAHREALDDSLKLVGFAEQPSPEIFLAADRLAHEQVEEYVRRRLSPTEFARFQKHDRNVKGITSALLGTPLKQMQYYAEQLDICDADAPEFRAKVGRFLVAEEGLFWHQVEEMTLYAIADLLRKRCRRLGLGDPQGVVNQENRQDQNSTKKQRSHRSDAGPVLKAEAKRDFVLRFLDKPGVWGGTLKDLSAMLMKEKKLKVSASTLSRYLKGSRHDRTGKPHRAAKGNGQREAVTEDQGPADLHDYEAWTMPDDPNEPIS